MTLNQLVYQFRLALIMERPEVRKDVLRQIMQDYCQDCGHTLEVGKCPEGCWDD